MLLLPPRTDYRLTWYRDWVPHSRDELFSTLARGVCVCSGCPLSTWAELRECLALSQSPRCSKDGCVKHLALCCLSSLHLSQGSSISWSNPGTIFLLTFWMDARFTQPCLQTDRAHPLHYLYIPFSLLTMPNLASLLRFDRETRFLQNNNQWKWSETRYICIAWYWSILALEYLTHNPPLSEHYLGVNVLPPSNYCYVCISPFSTWTKSHNTLYDT